jgi:hypothetical protein
MAAMKRKPTVEEATIPVTESTLLLGVLPWGHSIRLGIADTSELIGNR